MSPLKKSAFIAATIFLMFFIACGGGDKPNSLLPNPTPTPNPKDDDNTGQEIQFLINDIVPDAALAGATVTISYSGPDETPEIIWSGMTITGTPVTGGTDKKIAFQVPTGGESGPLHLKKGDSASNAVWFSLSATSVMTPRPEDWATDELGNQIVVNQVLISLHDDKNTYSEAERLAELVDGEIVGQITLMSAYQLLLKTKTLVELEEAIEILEADSSVKYALENFMVQGDDIVDWSKDPTEQTYAKNQRKNNNVEEGADLYVSEVHPFIIGKVHPVLVKIGVVEMGVDYNQKDFAEYEKYEENRNLNNIRLFANSGSVNDEYKGEHYYKHGTNVTGIIAATLGNGGMAGLLQAVSGAHGGFDINVKGSYDIHKLFESTLKIMDDGYQVINWSFGIHKKGAKNNIGEDVDEKANVKDEKTFNRFHMAATDLIRKIESDPKYSNVVIVAAAGNGSADAGDTNVHSPSSIKSDHLIIVGSHNDNPLYISQAYFSNYGDRVDISAAGWVTDYAGKYASGTSYSAPLVTATVALMLSIDPDLKPKEIKEILRKAALPVDNSIYDNNYDIIEGDNYVFTAPLTKAEVGNDNRLGKGARLNVEGAIRAVLNKRLGTGYVLVPYVAEMIFAPSTGVTVIDPATAAIVNAGFKVGTVTYENHDTIPSGRVLSQSPEGGTFAAAGSSVDLVISKGNATDGDVTVPDVTGMTEAGAITAITAAGFTIGTVTYENHDTIPSGRVLSQSPEGGTYAAPGSSVNLVISKGHATDGDEEDDDQPPPPITNGNEYKTISAGDGHTMAIKADGSLWAWGWNVYGQLGDGTTIDRYAPIKIMDSVVSVSAGTIHNMAIKTDGSLWAWGYNGTGELGDGTKIDRYTPVKIMDSVVSVSAGGSHTMAIKTDGSLWAWGHNGIGRLGDGTTTSRSTPVKIMDSVVSVSAGDGHTMAIKADGSLWAWGYNSDGQLGDGTRIDRYNPVKIMDSVVSVSAGGCYTMAIKTDGSLWAWGWNAIGQLGDGTTIDRYNPVKIMDSVVSVSAGGYHTMAIKSDGSLWAWGGNYYGPLGDGTRTSRSTPVKIMDSVVSVSAGSSHTMAITADGILWAWGYNYYGWLGDGTTLDRYTPVKIMDGVMLPTAVE